MAEGSDAETQATGVAIGDADTVAGPDTARASGRRVSPTRLGRFVIVRPLGSGGMSTVWEAEDPELGRRVAIKVLRGDRPSTAFTESLRREAQALAKLVHPNVVAVHDVGVDDGELFVVMQLVDGEPIDGWLRNRRATAAEVVAAFREAGKGLAAAHAAGLVHRDVKPGNILVDRDGAVRVGDFGLARNTGERAPSESGLAIAGTPSYMAPEQFDGLATPASDQYGFCVALYQLLAGELPFADATIDDRAAAKARGVPVLPRSAAPARVGRALARGMAVDPAARFPSMDALLVALAPPSRSWLTVAGPVVVLAIAGAAVAFAMSGSDAPAAPAAPIAAAPVQAGVPALGGLRPLTHYGPAVCAEMPTIDGEQVVFDRTEAKDTDLYEVPLAGGSPSQLTKEAPWEWRASPGRHPGEILYLIHDTGSDTGLAYLDVATRREDRFSNALASDAVATARGVVYVLGGGLELRRLAASSDTLFASAGSGEKYNQLVRSHRGDRIAAPVFAGVHVEMCVLDVATAARNCFDGGTSGSRPAFGANDRFLYYPGERGIHRRELATGSDALIAPDVQTPGGMAITPDGKALVYSDCTAYAKLVRWTTSPRVAIVEDPMVLYVAVTTDVRVWVHHAETTDVIVAHTATGERQVTDASFGGLDMLALSPNGQWIAFRSTGAHPGIYLIDLQAPAIEPVPISTNPDDRDPRWLGDDELVFVRKDAHSAARTIFVTSREGNAKLRALASTTRTPLGGRRHHMLVSSPERLYWVDEEREVETPGPVGDPRRMLSAKTSPGGRWLMFRTGNDGQHLMRMSLDPPGAVEELAPLEAGQTMAGTAIDDDGNVYGALQTWAGNLYVLPAKPGAPY